VRTTLGAVGRVLITAGILVLLFVAYQLWGTSIYQARAQGQLRDQFEQTLRRHPLPPTSAPSASTTVPATTTTAAPSPAPAAPAPGDAVAIIDIPKIGVSQAVIEGVDVSELRKGPGHYPATSLPGEEGNAAIAGHRTTYGAPFGDLDQLGAGDEITIRTVRGTFLYRVDARGAFAVDPGDGDVLNATADPSRPGHNLATLTLTTCTPKYSAAQRLIVHADLVLSPGVTALPPTPGTSDPTKAAIHGLAGSSSSRLPAVLWGLVAAVVGGLWWFLFHRRRKWYLWLAGAVPFLVVLFVFYTHLERLLPSNY
jgi:sortase A